MIASISNQDKYSHKPLWYWKYLPPSISKDEAVQEIEEMILIYKTRCPGSNYLNLGLGFMVIPENSLCKNYSDGDEARYYYLMKVINYWNKRELRNERSL